MIFIDTGAFLARYWRRDQYHEDALAFWKELEATGEGLLTSNLVLSETFTLLARWTEYRYAARKARALYASPRFTVVRPDAEDELAALTLFEKLADQKVSFTDCVSFALMRAGRIRQAFTFDHHFGLAGFHILPAWSVHEAARGAGGNRLPPGQPGDPAS